MGLDSLGSTELAFALGQHVNAELPETIAFDYPTIARLVVHVTARPQAVFAAPATTVPPVAGSVPVAGSDPDHLLGALERGGASPDILRGVCDSALPAPRRVKDPSFVPDKK